jgi:hypothetical protein
VQAGTLASLAPGKFVISIGTSSHTAVEQWNGIPLYWRDRHLRFHRYDQLEPSPDISDLLHEIDRDPIAIFWG